MVKALCKQNMHNSVRRLYFWMLWKNLWKLWKSLYFPQGGDKTARISPIENMHKLLYIFRHNVFATVLRRPKNLVT